MMPDILISMNKATDKLWKYADEWEKTPEHFDGVNPFCVAIHAVRQITNAPELLNEQKHGHWIEYPKCLEYDGALDDTYIVCSACEHVFNVIDNCTELFDYCPKCGTKMDEENEKEK